jgi:hypothetical protein
VLLFRDHNGGGSISPGQVRPWLSGRACDARKRGAALACFSDNPEEANIVTLNKIVRAFTH